MPESIKKDLLLFGDSRFDENKLKVIVEATISYSILYIVYYIVYCPRGTVPCFFGCFISCNHHYYRKKIQNL